MPARLAAAFVAAALAAAAPAAELPPNFVAKSFANADGSKSPYVVYVPPGLKPGTKPPVILFLHGAGETKGGSKQPVEQGIGNGHIARRKDFPAVVVIPQAEAVKQGVLGRWSPKAPDGARAIAILDEVMKEYDGDPARQYLTGVSMGGFGTWAVAAAYPARFAAIVPVCGGGDPKSAATIKDVPCWVWHGGDDRVVRPKASRDMVDALKAAGGAPKYTELAHIGHNSWDACYASEDLYTWLFAQVKKAE